MITPLLFLEQVLGAWGLGWEIWMDGMEITQFTYFQQVIAHVLTLYYRKFLSFWLMSSILALSHLPGWQSSIVTNICRDYLWSRAYPHAAAGCIIL